MSEYKTLVGIIGFMVISSVVLVTFNGGNVLFNLPAGTQPPQLFPSQSDIGFTTVDLEEDAFSSENITFIDPENTSYTDWNTDTVAVLEQGKEQGEIVYNTAGVESVEVLSGKDCGGFFGNSRLFIGSGQNTTGYDAICGETFANVEETDANFVVFDFRDNNSGSGDPALYQFSWSPVPQDTG